MTCPYFERTEKGYRCKITGKRVSIMLRPCLSNYESCPIYQEVHPRLESLFKCLSNSLGIQGFETEEMLNRMDHAKMPWETERCEECVCYSKRYSICLYDLVHHKNTKRCPVKEFIKEFKTRTKG